MDPPMTADMVTQKWLRYDADAPCTNTHTHARTHACTALADGTASTASQTEIAFPVIRNAVRRAATLASRSNFAPLPSFPDDVTQASGGLPDYGGGVRIRRSGNVFRIESLGTTIVAC